MGDSLNKIFERAVGGDDSLLHKVKGKGKELLDDFKKLSKPEKGEVLEELGKQIKERRDKMVEEVMRKAEEIESLTKDTLDAEKAI